MKRLIILDRDGVINFDSPDFIRAPAEWHAIPGSAEAIGRLTKSGCQVGVASNQSGVGRGFLDRTTLYRIHRKMRRTVAAHGGRIDKIAFCPHLPGSDCDCRKPAPGMLVRLLDYFDCEPGQAVFIGDSAKDIAAAMAAEIQPILVLTGNGQRTAAEAGLDERFVFPDLSHAASAILAGSVG